MHGWVGREAAAAASGGVEVKEIWLSPLTPIQPFPNPTMPPFPTHPPSSPRAGFVVSSRFSPVPSVTQFEAQVGLLRRGQFVAAFLGLGCLPDARSDCLVGCSHSTAVGWRGGVGGALRADGTARCCWGCGIEHPPSSGLLPIPLRAAAFCLPADATPLPRPPNPSCQLVILELLDHKPLLTGGYKAVLHIHSGEWGLGGRVGAKGSLGGRPPGGAANPLQ